MEEKLEETLRKLAAGQEKLENKTETLAAAVGEMASSIVELTRAVRGLAERQADTDRMLRMLGELSARTEKRFEEMVSAVVELTKQTTRQSELSIRTEIRFEEMRSALREMTRQAARTEIMFEEMRSAVRELTKQAARHYAAIVEPSVRTEIRFEEMRSALRELTRTVGELSGRAARTDMRMERMERIDKRLDDIHLVVTLLCKEHRDNSSKLDLIAEAIEDIDDVVLESKAKDQLPFFLKGDIRDLKVLDKDFVCQIISAAEDEGVLTKAESDDVGKADIFAFGFEKKTGDLVCLAVEVSAIVDAGDITMADRRSKLFAKAVRHFVESEPDKWEKMLKMVYPNHP